MTTIKDTIEQNWDYSQADEDIAHRAHRAYYLRFGVTAPIPCRGADLQYNKETKKNYVILSNMHGTLAVYFWDKRNLLHFIPNEDAPEYLSNKED